MRRRRFSQSPKRHHRFHVAIEITRQSSLSRASQLESDVDFVVLTDDKAKYLADDSWVAAALGERAEFVRTAGWGVLTEWRVVLASGLEVEFGFVPRSWASADPVDSGTRQVVAEGCSPVIDREGAFARLIAAVTAT